MERSAREIVVLFLAVWRISKMVTEEEGPADLFSRIREIAGAERDGMQIPWDSMAWYAKLISCPYCISVWLATAILIVGLADRRVYDLVLLSLAGSAATVLIEDIRGHEFT